MYAKNLSYLIPIHNNHFAIKYQFMYTIEF
jgi:hypothetical protein